MIALTDATGNLLQINSYDEYGIPAAGNQGRFQYTGQAWIPELGLHYYKARFYSPTLGRFLQVDPIGYDDQINLYAYVGNDPLNRRDPTGKFLLPPENPDPRRDWSSQSLDRDKGSESRGAVNDFEKNYKQMRESNVIGADKYFHCKANCEAAARGPEGEATAERLSDAREFVDRHIKRDPAEASVADQRANVAGRRAGAEARQSKPKDKPLDASARDQICRKKCEEFRPPSLSRKY